MQHHIERLRAHIDAGTLIRGAWTGTDEQGRETACLLAALVPQCGIEESASVCPAEVMPAWLAYLTPRIDDNGTVEAWPGMVARFASLASRWHALDADAWQRVKYRWLAAVVREAMSHTSEEPVVAVCERVATLCEGVVATGTIDAASFLAAEEEASAAAARAAAAAASAAWASAREVATAVRAARAAAEAAKASEARAAETAAWDRITAQLFEALERELEDDTCAVDPD